MRSKVVNPHEVGNIAGVIAENEGLRDALFGAYHRRQCTLASPKLCRRMLYEFVKMSKMF